MTHPKNPEYGGLVCKTEGCSRKNVYYVGPKSKSKSSAGVLIDMTNHNKRHRVNICYSCKDHPNGKPIDPSDKYAKQTEKGWICGTCIAEQNTKMLLLFNGDLK